MVYYAISAVHALDGKSYKRHKDTLANFNKDYVKTEIFPKAFGRRIARAEQIRHASERITVRKECRIRYVNKIQGIGCKTYTLVSLNIRVC